MQVLQLLIHSSKSHGVLVNPDIVWFPTLPHAENKSRKIKHEKRTRVWANGLQLGLAIARAGIQPWVIMKKTLVISVCQVCVANE